MIRPIRVAYAVIVVYFIVFGWVVSRALTGSPQANEPAAPVAIIPPDLSDMVRRQFGPCFQIATQSPQPTVKYLHPQPQPPWTPFLESDLDGDGVPDAVMVARCKDPLAGQAEFNYKVEDPYYSAHGYGNPQITAQFSSADPNAPALVLIIHGSGPAGWRAATPKSKFVIINLPFQTISLTRVNRGKRTLPAIHLQEAESMSSVVFWDGKKYRWQDVSRLN